MYSSYNELADIRIVRLEGIIDSSVAGQTYDLLVENSLEGGHIIVDLSGVHEITRAGARGLIVAARLQQTLRGDMRLCGATPAVDDFLKGLGFSHLLKCDSTIEESRRALRPYTVSERLRHSPAITLPSKRRVLEAAE